MGWSVCPALGPPDESGGAEVSVHSQGPQEASEGNCRTMANSPETAVINSKSNREKEAAPCTTSGGYS